MYNILICDDDRDIVAALKIYLTAEGYHTFEAYNGNDALGIIARETIHLVLLDVMMPGPDGLATTAALREKSNIPVILLTAKSEDTDKVLGLSIGADDYITKPFNPMEVLARVRSQLRRYTMLGGMHGMEKKPSIISIDGVEIDDEAKTVTVDGEPVNLTPIEYSILKLLMEHAGKVFSSARIYELVWKDPAWQSISGTSAKSLKSTRLSRAT